MKKLQVTQINTNVEVVAMLNSQADNYVLGLIRQEHPNWVEKDGTCKRCEQYYRNLNKVVFVGQY